MVLFLYFCSEAWLVLKVCFQGRQCKITIEHAAVFCRKAIRKSCPLYCSGLPMNAQTRNMMGMTMSIWVPLQAGLAGMLNQLR